MTEEPKVETIEPLEDAYLRLECFKVILSGADDGSGLDKVQYGAELLYNWVMNYEPESESDDELVAVAAEEQCTRKH